MAIDALILPRNFNRVILIVFLNKRLKKNRTIEINLGIYFSVFLCILSYILRHILELLRQPVGVTFPFE